MTELHPLYIKTAMVFAVSCVICNQGCNFLVMQDPKTQKSVDVPIHLTFF